MTTIFATGALERSAAFVAGHFAATKLHIDPFRVQAEMQRLSQQMGDAQRPAAGGGAGGELSEFAQVKRNAQIERLSSMADAEPIDAGAGWYGLTPDGIAIISVVGPLLARSDWWTRYLDLMTYDTLPLVAEAAGTDPRVKGIMLDMDTPGGHAANMMDCADRIAAVRQAVPVYAVANPLAASAGYGIACAADRVFVPRMATVGSIGVVLIHLDMSGLDQDWGLKFTAIYSGARKVDGWSHAELSAEAMAGFQASVDDGRLKFAEHVAKYRTGMTVDAVLGTEADCFDDTAAVSVGLADEVASFDQALVALREDIRATAPARSPAGNRAARAKVSRKALVPRAADDPEDDPAEFKPCDGCPTPDACRDDGQCEDEQDDEDEGREASARPPARRAAARQPQGFDEGVAYVAAVNEACSIAKMPGRAAAFIAARTPLEKVRHTLVDAIASEGNREAITSHPETMPSAQAGSLVSAAMVKAAEMRAQRNGG